MKCSFRFCERDFDTLFQLQDHLKLGHELIDEEEIDSYVDESIAFDGLDDDKR